MIIQEINDLLRPYKITFECESCEGCDKTEIVPLQIRCANLQTGITSKKIRKVAQDFARKPEPLFLQIKKAEINNQITKDGYQTDYRLVSQFKRVLSARNTLTEKNSSVSADAEMYCEKLIKSPVANDVAFNGEISKPVFDFEATAETHTKTLNTNIEQPSAIWSLKKDLFTTQKCETDDGGFQSFGSKTDCSTTESTINSSRLELRFKHIFK